MRKSTDSFWRWVFCWWFISILVVVFASSGSSGPEKKSSSHDLYLEHKYLDEHWQRANGFNTIGQIVVTEDQLLNMSPVYLSQMEIIPASEHTVVLKGRARLLALIHYKLYCEDVRKWRLWHRKEKGE